MQTITINVDVLPEEAVMDVTVGKAYEVVATGIEAEIKLAETYGFPHELLCEMRKDSINVDDFVGFYDDAGDYLILPKEYTL